MKILLEYDELTGTLTGSNGLIAIMQGMIGFEQKDKSEIVLDLVKQGVSPDDIIKMKNNDLL